MLIRWLATALTVLSAQTASADRAACATHIKSATWSGSTLVVVPTRCGRRTATRRAFREAITKGGLGAPNRRSLYRQFRCHATFAAFKPEWNLESYRPVVPWSEMIATGCNP